MATIPDAKEGFMPFCNEIERHYPGFTLAVMTYITELHQNDVVSRSHRTLHHLRQRYDCGIVDAAVDLYFGKTVLVPEDYAPYGGLLINRRLTP